MMRRVKFTCLILFALEDLLESSFLVSSDSVTAH
jgi:hypothetical protein